MSFHFLNEGHRRELQFSVFEYRLFCGLMSYNEGVSVDFSTLDQKYIEEI